MAESLLGSANVLSYRIRADLHQVDGIGTPLLVRRRPISFFSAIYARAESSPILPPAPLWRTAEIAATTSAVLQGTTGVPAMPSNRKSSSRHNADKFSLVHRRYQRACAASRRATGDEAVNQALDVEDAALEALRATPAVTLKDKLKKMNVQAVVRKQSRYSLILLANTRLRLSKPSFS